MPGLARDSFAAVLQRLGRRIDPQVLAATVAHWSGRVDATQLARVPDIVDMAYGDHARHRLDVYPVKGQGAPVVLFVHGGGVTGGDKQVAPPFYANVGRYFAAHGMLAACMNYRRAPAGGALAAPRDVDAAARWLLQRAELYGGDAARFVVIGQSAGASHVATWLFHPAFAGSAAAGAVRGAVLMSGRYQSSGPTGHGPVADFGDEAPGPRAGSRAAAPALLLLTTTDHDPPELRQQTIDLAQALDAPGAPVQRIEWTGHNHVSPLMSLGSDADAVGLALRRFVSGATAAGPRAGA